MTPPTPHKDKLISLLENEKLPSNDKPRVQKAIEKHAEWCEKLTKLVGNREELISQSISLLNEYRLFLDLEFIFDSSDDFLYRQKGQLKLDNSVLEEFLPYLIRKEIIPEMEPIGVTSGPRSSFSSLFFISSLASQLTGGGPNIRTKDQDFAISKPLYIRTSHSATFESDVEQIQTNITYVAAECKTNLDKTMFQEACSTARDTKFAVSGARYYLLCEWLDMAPLSTASTEIDEVLILRKAKRINSNVRSRYSTFEGRKRSRADYEKYLLSNPFDEAVFRRLINHIEGLIRNEAPIEADVLKNGFF